MTLLEVASKPPVAAPPDMPVLRALELMAEKKIGAILVTDVDGTVLGIFTERDNMLRVSLERRDLEHTRLSDVMTAPVDCAPPDLTPIEALDRMLEAGYRHLPIVDADNRALGVVSLRHLLLLRVKEQEHTLEYLEGYIGAGGPG